MNGLKETVKLMESDDFKERFQAEYYQTKIRRDKLHEILIKIQAGTLEFEPKCPIELLANQETAMSQYLTCLEIRAQIEGIEL